MKKILTAFLVLVMVLGLAACSSKEENIPGTLSEIMAKITDVPSLEIAVMETELNAENWEHNTKIAMPEGAEGLVSDAMISAQAHSVVLIRLPEGADGDAIAQEILEKNTDPSQPSKWICVNPEMVEVVRRGDLILFVQSFETTTDEIVEKFNEL